MSKPTWKRDLGRLDCSAQQGVEAALLRTDDGAARVLPGAEVLSASDSKTGSFLACRATHWRNSPGQPPRAHVHLRRAVPAQPASQYLIWAKVVLKFYSSSTSQHQA